MFGFIGMIRNNPITSETSTDEIEKQNNMIIYPSMDGEGHLHDGYATLGFPHLKTYSSEIGIQPNLYNNDHLWLIFNGEIYNAVELREQLAREGYAFTGESSAEVIAALF